jgi:hypothetical protein
LNLIKCQLLGFSRFDLPFQSQLAPLRQGRFINPAGGFNPSGAPRRIPKEHGQWGDWECEACGGHNRKHRTSCFTCFVPKPTEAKSAHYTTSVGGRAMKD